MSNLARARTMLSAWESLDPERILQLFADDAVWHNMPIHPARGKEEIRVMMMPFVEETASIRFNVIHESETADGTVFHERIDTVRLKNGHEGTLHAVGVLEFRGGLVTAWRDYFDWREFQAQVGQSELAEPPALPS